jgi:adenylate cyclase
MRTLARWARTFGLTRAICILLLLALIPLRIVDPPPLEEIRLRTFDFYQSLRPRQTVARPVTIVDIDETSLKEIGQWPWPRTIVADLVTQLSQLGAVAIAFDVIFAEPDRMSPSIAAASFRNLDDDTRNKLRSLPSNDEVLAEAIQRSRVVVGQVGSATPVPRSETEAALPTGFAVKGPDPSPFLVTFAGLLRNVPAIEQAAAGRGVFSILPERDGIVRRVPIIMQAQGAMVPSLSMELLRAVADSGAILVRADEAGVQSVAVPGLELPTDQNGRLWVHFNRHDPGRYISANDVLQGRVSRDNVERKLVLIGTSAAGLLDVKTTPVAAAMPGVEVHAQILESALANSLLTYPSYAIGAELVVAVVVGLAIIIVAPMLRASIVIALGAVVVAALIGVSWYLFSQYDLLIDFTYPLLASGFVYLTLIFVNYFQEQKQRQQIRAAFGYYLSPALVEQLARSPEKLVLGGEERRMTILFGDVRGFTTFSEH